MTEANLLSLWACSMWGVEQMITRLFRLVQMPVLSLRAGLAQQPSQVNGRGGCEGAAEPGPSQPGPSPLSQHSSHLPPWCGLGEPLGAGELSHAQHPCSQDPKSEGIVRTHRPQPQAVSLRQISTTQEEALHSFPALHHLPL